MALPAWSEARRSALLAICRDRVQLCQSCQRCCAASVVPDKLVQLAETSVAASLLNYQCLCPRRTPGGAGARVRPPTNRHGEVIEARIVFYIGMSATGKSIAAVERVRPGQSHGPVPARSSPRHRWPRGRSVGYKYLASPGFCTGMPTDLAATPYVLDQGILQQRMVIFDPHDTLVRRTANSCAYLRCSPSVVPGLPSASPVCGASVDQKPWPSSMT